MARLTDSNASHSTLSLLLMMCLFRAISKKITKQPRPNSK